MTNATTTDLAGPAQEVWCSWAMNPNHFHAPHVWHADGFICPGGDFRDVEVWRETAQEWDGRTIETGRVVLRPTPASRFASAIPAKGAK